MIVRTSLLAILHALGHDGDAPSAVAKEFLRFLAVGAVGFLIDGGALLALTASVGLTAISARLISFSIAVTVTWLLNRLFTFRRRASGRRLAEWRRYVAVNGVGGLINLGIFALLAGPVPGLGVHPLVAFAIASAVALIFNFVGSRTFAFRGGAAREVRQEGPPPV